MNLSDLQKEAHAIAKDHGWWDEERTFGDLIALVHSELSEALEAYREFGFVPIHVRKTGLGETLYERHLQKPVGVASELADVVIRVADMAEYCGGSLTLEDGPQQVDDVSFGTHISMAHLLLSEAMSIHLATNLSATSLKRPLPEGKHYWIPLLSAVVHHVLLMATHYGIDLDAAIAAKMEYNRGRAYRHGGKAL